jgi:hypothetical protein
MAIIRFVANDPIRRFRKEARIRATNLSRDSIKNRYPESKAIARAARVTLSGMQSPVPFKAAAPGDLTKVSQIASSVPLAERQPRCEFESRQPARAAIPRDGIVTGASPRPAKSSAGGAGFLDCPWGPAGLHQDHRHQKRAIASDSGSSRDWHMARDSEMSQSKI